MTKDSYEFKVEPHAMGNKITSTYSHSEDTMILSNTEALTLARKILATLIENEPDIKMSIKVYDC